MAKKRKAEPAVVTKVQFDKALEDYSANSLSLAEVTAQRDAKIKEIMDQYTGQIANLENVQDSQFETIRNFCVQNQNTLFSAKKRSMETALATLGLRKDTPSVVLASGKNWEGVIKLLKQKLPGYIRTKDEVLKTEILSKRNEIGTQLTECGIVIKQEERFFIKLKEKEPVATPVIAEKKEEEILIS